MNKFLFLLLMSLCSCALSFEEPSVSITFNGTVPSTVVSGELARIPVQMTYSALRFYKSWSVPAGSYLEFVAGSCPAIPYDEGSYWRGTCYMNIVIPGGRPGSVISGALSYGVYLKEGRFPNKHELSLTFFSPAFSVRVIPHSISMLTIPIQEATANTSFSYNLKSAVKFYDENAQAGYPPKVIVSQEKLDGLFFNPTTFCIEGKPTRTGTYKFSVGAVNSYGTAAFTDFKVQVRVNEKDKPVFKQNYPIPGASPGEKYSLNLMDLIEPQAGFMETNQISFRIDPNKSHPEWLLISKEHPTFLEGEVPVGEAGKEVDVTLIASSNTGGDCLRPLTIKIPVAIDPTKKPTINSFKLEKLAGANIYEELSGYISDPAHDPAIQLILEKVEPTATWLKMSSLHPTILEGTVPDQATGQKYLLTLRANTLIGGNSDPVTIPLNISVDKKQMPRFKSDKPILPILYPGQPYLYDFVENNDVYPEYHDAPYEIQFAEGFNPPDWLRLEQNQLIADMVPPEIVNEDLEIKIMIKNIPGGLSNEYILSLTIMN
ncbi:Ig domain-containing protein [Legionella moravica]|uniref:Ig domain-containing protein n=1 Tax=Legionella moravica TaxID=39962 RepID=UPI00105596BE|nr:Ig domain-containing protein [Legionella moravica]